MTFDIFLLALVSSTAAAEPPWPADPVPIDLGDESIFVVDLDGDGDEDVVSASWMDDGPKLRVHLNDAGALRFAPEFVERQPEIANGGAAADFDGDGFADLVATGATSGEIHLYRNDGGRRLLHWQRLRPSCKASPCDRFLSSASFVDLDRDGRLEIFVGDVLGPSLVYVLGDDRRYRLDADHSLGEVSANVAHHMFGDLDNDGVPELVTATNGLLAESAAPRPGIRLFASVGGVYREIFSPALADIDPSAEGVLLLDVDNDGLLDLFVSTFRRGAKNALFLNRGSFRFERAGVGFGLEGGGESAVNPSAADFDNDGWIDLFVTSFVGEDRLFRNLGGRSFESLPVPERTARGSVIGTWIRLEDDGRSDLLVSRRSPAPDAMYVNRVRDAGNWLRVVLRGEFLNRSAIGARVEVLAQGMTQTRELFGNGYDGLASAPLFGIGAARQAERIRVRWPSGAEHCRFKVPANRTVVIEKNETSGCR